MDGARIWNSIVAKDNNPEIIWRFILIPCLYV